MAFKWTRDLIENLILNVEQNACIYNVKSPQYMDRIKKAQAYNCILAEMQQLDATITIDLIKKKWKNLRTQFMQEVRAVKQSKKSGSGREDVHIPKLWCFGQLSFLKMHIDMRPSLDNTAEKENTPSNSDENLESEEPPKKRQKTKTLGAVSALQSGIGNVKAMLQERRAGKQFAWLGTLVANQMERINPDHQDDATWQVQCLMNRLINESRMSTSSTSTPYVSTSSRDIIAQSMEGIFDDDDVILF